MQMTLRQLIDFINQMPIVDACEVAGVSLPRGAYSQPIICPFHDDHRPSAKVYIDSNHIRCFTENKTYRSFDLLCKVHPKKEVLRRFIVNYGIELVSKEEPLVLQKKELPFFELPASWDAFLQFAEQSLVRKISVI